MIRTFIALELEETLQRFLGGRINRMAQALPSLRWVDPTGIHLTLAFLGELTDEQVKKAIQATEAAARQSAPFAFRLSDLGVFDSLQQPRVIWMGIDEILPGHLAQLHKVLNQELEQRAFEVDKRPLSPHLTLARVKAPLKPDEQQRLQRLLMEMHGAQAAPVQQVSQLSVMKSELSRSGAIYTCLQECVLGPRT